MLFSSEPFESLRMKLLLVSFLVFSVWLHQAEAFRLPLPYGTGIHEHNGQNLDFFSHLLSYFNQEDPAKVPLVSHKGTYLNMKLDHLSVLLFSRESWRYDSPRRLGQLLARETSSVSSISNGSLQTFSHEIKGLISN